jgi:putative DNA primase/helicase
MSVDGSMDKLNIKQNHNLEVSIVGCLLKDGSLIRDESVSKLKVSDFMYADVRTVFQSIKELEFAQEPIDVTTVIDRLKKTGKLDKVGGVFFITGLIDEVISTAHLPSYAETLIRNTSHNAKMRVVENVRIGKADPSKLENLNDAERSQRFDDSDTGNAHLLASLHSKNMRFNHTEKQWLVWNGQYWGKDKKMERYNYAEDVSKARQRNAMSIKDNKEKIQAFSFAVRSGDKNKIESMLTVSTTLKEIATSSEDWDTDDLSFQCDNGVFVLTDGSFIEGKPDFMISQCSGVNYDPNAECPIFDQFLLDIMDGDEELTEYLLMCLGYSMSGLTDEQCMFILNGNGANGKSVLLDLMSFIYGDYTVHTRFDAFLKKFNNTSTNDLARLSKARMVTANESGVGKNWDEERIKEITGGDKITARFMYADYFEFRSQIKLWCATNNLPKTDDLTDAFWRRMVVIPFDKQFKGADRNTNILEELKRESSGILNRLYQGFQQWTDTTLKNPPPRVVDAVKEYMAESDVVFRWVDMAGVTKNGNYDTISAKQLYKLFKDWFDNNESGKPLSQLAFGKGMKSRGMGSEKIGGNRVYVGIDINNQD